MQFPGIRKTALLTSELVLPGVHPVLLRRLLEGSEMSQDPDEVAKVDHVTLGAVLGIFPGPATSLKKVGTPRK
jgi:hypothetical protein